MDASTAARFRADRAVSTFSRIHRAEDAWCTVLCDSYEFAFSTGWCVPGSQLCNDVFERTWAEPGAPGERFDRAITATLAEFRAAAAALWIDDDFDPSTAAAALIAVMYDGALHVRWLGDHVAMLIRDGAVIAATEPHTVAGELARHGIDPIGHPHASIIARMISIDPMHEPDRVDWEARPGDRVLVLAGEVTRSLRPVELVARLAAPPDLAANAIVDAVVERDNPFGVIATAIDL